MKLQVGSIYWILYWTKTIFREYSPHFYHHHTLVVYSCTLMSCVQACVTRMYTILLAFQWHPAGDREKLKSCAIQQFSKEQADCKKKGGTTTFYFCMIAVTFKSLPCFLAAVGALTSYKTIWTYFILSLFFSPFTAHRARFSGLIYVLKVMVTNVDMCICVCGIQSIWYEKDPFQHVWRWVVLKGVFGSDL